jgi:hypothetical protein
MSHNGGREGEIIMFRSFTVKNFRCFRELTLEPLERVNLIAGKNNTGKTALLEAIHLHSYPRDCELPFLVNEWRGTNSERKYDGDSCGWLFFDEIGASGLELHSENNKGEPNILRMWFVDPVTAEEQFPELAQEARRMVSPPGGGGYHWLILKSNTKGKEVVSIIAPHGVGFSSLGRSPVPWNGPSVFIRSSGRSPKEDATAFSDLEIANRQDEILPSLRILEPRLQRLSILLLADQPVIHGHIGLARQVPIFFMGEGIRRLLSILLAIHTAAGGNVLIDEVENGLHHSIMVQVWQAIAEAARRADVQVFATTHSYECIQAAHQAFVAAQPYDLRLFRLDRLDQELRVAVYNQNTLNTSIDMSLEVR